MPVGWFTAVESSGLRPWPAANGTQPMPHIAAIGSGPSPMYVVDGARQTPMVRTTASST